MGMKQRRASNRRLVAGVVLALTALGVAPLPLASAAVTPTLRVVTKDPAINGEVVKLDGAITPSGRTVKLQQRVDQGAWTAVASSLTSTGGAFQFKTSAPAAPARLVSYRAVAPQTALRGTT